MYTSAYELEKMAQFREVELEQVCRYTGCVTSSGGLSVLVDAAKRQRGFSQARRNDGLAERAPVGGLRAARAQPVRCPASANHFPVPIGAGSQGWGAETTRRPGA